MQEHSHRLGIICPEVESDRKTEGGKVDAFRKFDVMRVPTQIERAQMDIPGLALAAEWIGLLLTSQPLRCSLPACFSGSKQDPQLKKKEDDTLSFPTKNVYTSGSFKFFGLVTF
ncbi:hypothetical protein TGME49_263135 [Toxoplasma gondii ME49]|uniref:Uncharacterized protein n=3 Tax=Toxoplasma gondii TaxID=5811 RepID=A0A2G8YE25_TOXGO|nr:hypothetical protein TGME49_263135 [Toxoplasma gondii ME49]EPT29707.1 hypothetical protein TGME49_263135 [Toxoplasma gondii ME49]KYF40750.1 hypothetical protein TGARI_263135 [Toxoplasma gondii ARI]PIM05525.1 hypothetical protein TGCOUG_263135 [Toxoplasma gondii COUG]|eukprot:XP_018637149.1 hypothetical protein TGME49_263135 [Toxoplasma gondii ME49]